MKTALIILAIVIGIVSITYNISRAISKSRKKEYHDWEVDDLLTIDRVEFKKEGLELSGGYQYAVLKGWDDNYLYVDLGNEYVRQVGWNVIDLNKSALWRRNYANCEKAMGKKPGFGSVVKHEISKSSGKIDGKPIELLNETECQVYLTQAITDENYELAEQLRKRMEKFR